MLRYILINVLRRKGRALFAILGIGIGISAVISLEAVADGMIDGVQNMLQKLPGSHIILEKGSTGIPFSNLDDSYVAKIRDVDGVEWVEPFIFQMRKLPTYYRSDLLTGKRDSDEDVVERMVPVCGFKIDGVALKNCKIEENWDGFDKSIVGKPGAPIQMLVGKDVEITWKRHMKKEFPREMKIFIFKFKTAGIFNAGSFLRTTIVIPYEDAQRFMNKIDACSGISLNLKKGYNEKKVLSEIREISDILEVIRSDEYLGSYEELEWFQQMISLIGLIAAFAGASSVLITMISNVHERTREIGLLIAVGWKPRMIVTLTITEGIILSFIGGLVACGLGIVEVEMFSFRFDFNPLPNGFPLEAFVKGIVLSVILGAVGSALPAIRAARMRPIDALRFE